MLNLLKLPPDTPVYGLKHSAAEPAHRPEPPSVSVSGPVIQTKPLDEALAEAAQPSDSDFEQREITVDKPEASTGDAQDGQAEGPDIDDLARKVYRILKDRLRVERERSAH